MEIEKMLENKGRMEFWELSRMLLENSTAFEDEKEFRVEINNDFCCEDLDDPDQRRSLIRKLVKLEVD
jgi:hypothetical protein